MHGLDVDAHVRCVVPNGMDVCGHVAGRERNPLPVIDIHPIRRQLGEFAPVDCSEGPRDE